MEKKLADGHGQRSRLNTCATTRLTAADSSNGWYGAGLSYLFPQVVGIGKFQVLAKYSEDHTTDAADGIDKLKTTVQPQLHHQGVQRPRRRSTT